jgi:hypothetical protein
VNSADLVEKLVCQGSEQYNRDEAEIIGARRSGPRRPAPPESSELIR